uniref:protein-serine/threonine phosphatase n=1 Tax=Solanum tuberosum TaxID=4113 RepID=M1CLF9_SOLTU
MAGMCCGVNIAETEATAPVEPSSEAARRRRMGIHQFRFVPTDAAASVAVQENGRKRHRIEKVIDNKKRQKLETSVTISLSPPPVAVVVADEQKGKDNEVLDLSESGSQSVEIEPDLPKFGATSVCGRRRDMEDAVAIHPSFCKENSESSSNLHFFGVYDGHGCSHVNIPKSTVNWYYLGEILAELV